MLKDEPIPDREMRLLTNYGITAEAYTALEQAQNHKCKICRTPAYKASHTGTLHVDHDHDTGEVRGLLCLNCNLMLGHAKDNPSILLKGIQYLKRRL